MSRIKKFHFKGYKDLSIIEKITSNGNFLKSRSIEGKKKGFEEADYDLFKEAKEQLGNELNFELDEKNKKILIKNLTKSIRAVSRVISYRDRITLNQKHIIEGPADRIIK